MAGGIWDGFVQKHLQYRFRHPFIQSVRACARAATFLSLYQTQLLVELFFFFLNSLQRNKDTDTVCAVTRK